MNDNKLQRPIWQLTVEEFIQILDGAIKSEKEPTNNIPEKEYVYGINGLAAIMGCSRTNAQKIKSSGIIDEAIIQTGRKIIIDKQKALELLKTKQSG